MILVKIHRNYRNVVVICDSEIIGRKFEEGKKQLEIRENFFKGEQMKKEEIIKIIENNIRNDSTFNIVGENSVKLALESGLVNEESVGYIEKVPMVLVF